MARSDYLLQHETEAVLEMTGITINKYLREREVTHFPLPVKTTGNIKLYLKQEILDWKQNYQEPVQKYYRNKGKTSKAKKENYILNLIANMENHFPPTEAYYE